MGKTKLERIVKTISLTCVALLLFLAEVGAVATFFRYLADWS